ncbi:NAD(P)-binding oxidoreductase [Aestuariicoccus sp. MJ-SS9]|uniref:NAD(P)-dependent oxidoreductase n=1 Tax=Aestuariicoccus sp. MJ-SS9 TaxID=3079855 RepID=UPI002908E6DD|nr:NAD(P)-binding oxidoreductase [Aestuariicoccus sp. MJ-SS9]MDU8911357.1 NAD(P)-binding oxidoreductase [Aestuariicoccus sp. MJ-SS9]
MRFSYTQEIFYRNLQGKIAWIIPGSETAPHGSEANRRRKLKLVVLGANGRTGRLVVREALDIGDSVTAVVRSDAKRLALQHSRLRVVVGDPCDPTFLGKIIAGHDAVISTLGGRRPTKGATSVYWRSADAIVEAAWNAGIAKIAVTSSALLFPPGRLLDRVLAIIVPNVVQSAARMEQTFDNAKLDVVVARCGFLTDDKDPGYRAELGSLPFDGSSVPRLGVARFLLDAVRKPSSGLKIYGVSGPV